MFGGLWSAAGGRQLVVDGGALARERGHMEGRSRKLLFVLAHGVGVVVGQVTRTELGWATGVLLAVFF